MYSFYGGQKGQDFKITRIFQNRSEDMLQDLRARWFSPVNVGDYVFISYGDIAEQDTYFDEIAGEKLSTYTYNLKYDLEHCGKNYCNSLWQKVYIDEDKQVSPLLPDTDGNNLFVFLNFEDNREPIYEAKEDGSIEQIGWKEGIDRYGRPIDAEGNVIDDKGNIILYHQTPGESLRETANIYTEENYGLGYRLICCLTGQTPRIEVFYETIGIEDGPPSVTLDITQIEKPKIKFYLQKAQTLNDEVSTIIIPPYHKPDVDLITEGMVAIDGRSDNIQKATLTNPILEFELPRPVRYFTGYLFGKGRLSDYPWKIATEEMWQQSEWPEKANYKYTGINAYLTRACSYAIVAGNERGKLNKDYNFDYVNASLFRQGFSESITKHSLINNIYFKSESYLDFLKSDNIDSKLIPWGTYGLNKDKAIEEINENNLTIVQYCNSYASTLESIIEVMNRDIINATDNASLNLEYEYWSKYGLPSADEFNGLLSLKDKKKYCENYINGLIETNSIIPLISTIQIETPVRDLKQTVIDIFHCDDEFYYFEEMQGKFFHFTASQLQYIVTHFAHILNEALPGDIYVHTPSGRMYQFIAFNNELKESDIDDITSNDSETIKEHYENSYVKINYLGALTAPSPEIEYKNKNAFIKEGKKWKVNNITVTDSILVGTETKGHAREKYIFNIPKTPDWEVNYQVVNYQTDPEASLTIEDNGEGDGEYTINLSLPREPQWDTTVQTVTNDQAPSVAERPVIGTNSDTIYLDFKLPRPIHFYSDAYPNLLPSEITGFDKTGEGKPITTITNSNDNLSKGDIYLYTAFKGNNEFGEPQYDVLDRLRGFVYVYDGEGTWARQGSLVGPIGVPKTTKTITFVKDATLPQGEVVRVPETGELQYYKYSWYDELPDIVNKYNITDGIPNSLIGEAYIFQTGILEGDNVQIQETWWGQYYEPDWSITLVTGGFVLLDSYEENENIAKSNTYNAKYINEKMSEIKQNAENSVIYWNTDNYY